MTGRDSVTTSKPSAVPNDELDQVNLTDLQGRLSGLRNALDTALGDLSNKLAAATAAGSSAADIDGLRQALEAVANAGMERAFPPIVIRRLPGSPRHSAGASAMAGRPLRRYDWGIRQGRCRPRCGGQDGAEAGHSVEDGWHFLRRRFPSATPLQVSQSGGGAPPPTAAATRF